MRTSLTRLAAFVIAAFVLAIVQPVYLLAQDTKKLDVDIDIDKGGSAGNFFTQPWVWIVGGAVFILLLVALMRGRGGRRDA